MLYFKEPNTCSNTTTLYTVQEIGDDPKFVRLDKLYSPSSVYIVDQKFTLVVVVFKLFIPLIQIIHTNRNIFSD